MITRFTLTYACVLAVLLACATSLLAVALVVGVGRQGRGPRGTTAHVRLGSLAAQRATASRHGYGCMNESAIRYPAPCGLWEARTNMRDHDEATGPDRDTLFNVSFILTRVELHIGDSLVPLAGALAARLASRWQRLALARPRLSPLVPPKGHIFTATLVP